MVTDPCCSVDNHSVVILSDFEHFITYSFVTGPVLLKHKTLPLTGQRTFDTHGRRQTYIETHTTKKTKAPEMLKFDKKINPFQNGGIQMGMVKKMDPRSFFWPAPSHFWADFNKFPQDNKLDPIRRDPKEFETSPFFSTPV